MLKEECGEHELNHTRSTGYHVLSMGGEKVEPNTFPWIAAVFADIENGKGMGCSAVQISRRHILTAAHCFFQEKLDAEQRAFLCGLLHHNNIDPKSVANLFLKPIKHIEAYATSNHTGRIRHRNRSDMVKLEIEGHPYVHKGYDPCTFNNDIAVIELKSDVPREVGSPICMRENEKLADMLTAAGYGRDPEHPDARGELHWLQKVDFDSRDMTESATKITTSVYRKSVCQGDSGGPLFQLNHENKYVLVGITSYGIPCDMKVEGKENIFVNVRNYRDWICRYTGVCPIQQTKSSQGDGNLTKNRIEIFIGAKKVSLTDRK